MTKHNVVNNIKTNTDVHISLNNMIEALKKHGHLDVQGAKHALYEIINQHQSPKA